MTRYSGSCHCGAVRFSIEASIADIYVCDCSICRKRNAPMTNVHKDALKLLAGEDRLTLYQWNTRIARHYFCSVCGIYPFHRKRSMPDHYGVNVRCLDDFDPAGLPVRRADGRGMSLETDERQPGWTGPGD